MTPTNHLALFDFDGTISSKDSLEDFIRFAVGDVKYYMGLAVLSPILGLYVLKLMPNHVAKQKMMAHFFKDWEAERFKALATRYALEQLPNILRPKAMERIRWHQQQGHTVVVVSASIECWLQPWCEQIGVALLGTQLETQQNRLTGRFSSPNCYGEEKVHRLHAAYALETYSEIYAYGDSSGDKPMLQLATHPFYKPFQ